MKNKNNSDTPLSRTNRTPPAASHEEVSARARQIWEEKGRPAGQDDEIWYEAERHLKSAATSPKEERAFANPARLLNPDNDPSSRVENRLREAAAQPSRRSATSL